MPEDQAHLSVREQEGVQIVEFSDRKILEELSIREIEDQLFALVKGHGSVKLLLDFKNVEHLSSAALGMLINLEKEVSQAKGRLMLSDINPQIYEVFKITRLNKMFEIHDTTAQALKRFS
jgi:anti-sigma B factor antagonist